MKKRNLDDNKVKIELVRAMLSHVPFDGWTWTAMEQGAVNINFKKNKSKNERLEIYKTFFNNGTIDFIKVFAEIIDSRVQENYNSLDPKPQRIPEKIKKLILMRLDFCLPYKEAIRSSLSLSALPKNSKQSIKILYTTCNSMWKLAGDKATDFSFYTKRLSLASVYASTLLFWLNDTSSEQEETEYFLERRLHDISMIAKLKKPLNMFKNISNNINVGNNSLGIKSIFNIIKSINKIKKSSFSKPF